MIYGIKSCRQIQQHKKYTTLVVKWTKHIILYRAFVPDWIIRIKKWTYIVDHNMHNHVTWKAAEANPWVGFSLIDGIHGCSKVLGCFFFIFGIPMGGFPFQIQCAQIAKLGVFLKNWEKKKNTTKKPATKWVFLAVICYSDWWFTKSHFSKYRDGQNYEKSTLSIPVQFWSPPGSESKTWSSVYQLHWFWRWSLVQFRKEDHIIHTYIHTYIHPYLPTYIQFLSMTLVRVQRSRVCIETRVHNLIPTPLSFPEGNGVEWRWLNPDVGYGIHIARHLSHDNAGQHWLVIKHLI